MSELHVYDAEAVYEVSMAAEEAAGAVGLSAAALSALRSAMVVVARLDGGRSDGLKRGTISKNLLLLLPPSPQQQHTVQSLAQLADGVHQEPKLLLARLQLLGGWGGGGLCGGVCLC